jgi:hypothetical protein
MTVIEEAKAFGHVISVGQGETLRMLDTTMPSQCAPGINQALPRAVAESFEDGIYIRCRATRRIPLWRFHSDDGKMWKANILGQREEGLAFKIGQWWTPQAPGSAAARPGWEVGDDRAGYAIKAAWSDMSHFTRATMLVPGHFFYGRAAPQDDNGVVLPGGWPQFLILPQWLSWVDDRQAAAPTGR